MAENTLSAGPPTTQLHTPLFVPFLNVPSDGVVLYCDDFYLAEHKGRIHLLCGDAGTFQKELEDAAGTMTRLTAADAYLFLSEDAPVALLQKGAKILRYDAHKGPEHIYAIKALQGFVHRCKGLVRWKNLKYHAHPITATFCAEGLKRTGITLSTGAKALKLDL